MLNFRDVVKSNRLEGSKVPIDQILGKPIIISKFEFRESKFKSTTEFCTCFQFYFEDDVAKENHVVFTGSSVIRSQLEEVKKELQELNEVEFRTVVVKESNYYKLS